jgi:DUF1680 family protein
VAHYQTTGQTTLLTALSRYADLIGRTFGRGRGQRRGYGGHPEIELALIKLYRVTGERRYRDLARYFVDERGRQPHYFDREARARGEDPARWWAKNYAYCQAHQPVREQTQVAGHAVRALYLYAAMADLAGECGDAGLRRACDRIWDHLVSRSLYLTAGVGPSRHNEGFTNDYDLPNYTAYAETCAAIALVFWSYRLLQLEGDSRYADVLEQALYNGVLSGVSLDGERFFYENPLASRGDRQRQPWFGCACCPPNIARLLASLGEYVYSQNDREVAVHLFVQGQAGLTVAGQPVQIEQRTRYPWAGRVTLTVRMERPTRFTLRVRLPGWCRAARWRVNGRRQPVRRDRGYAVISRTWRTGDRVVLDLDMPVERIYADPRVGENAGRVALRRGPVVYCLEEVDNHVLLPTVALPAQARLRTTWRPKLLGGVITIAGRAFHEPVGQGELYRTAAARRRPFTFRAVPYATWANRRQGAMVVWLRDEPARAVRS